MFLQYRTQGFILKKEDRGEADRLFTIYTKDFGKLEILGRAIRKIASKLRSGAEIFYLSEIEFIQGKTYKTLTDVSLIENFPNIRKNLEKLRIAYKISELLDNFIKGQEPEENIWNLLKEVFQKLNNFKLRPSNIELVYYFFLWNLLSILGYKAELYNCAICEKKLTPEKLYFNLKEGGIICQNCFKKKGVSFRSGKEINPEVVKILRIILKGDWQTLSKLKIQENYKKSLNSISRNYLNYVLGQIK